MSESNLLFSVGAESSSSSDANLQALPEGIEEIVYLLSYKQGPQGVFVCNRVPIKHAEENKAIFFAMGT
jgi:hypothetical protein